MAKRVPHPCSAEACGDNYPVCGKYSTYINRRCRCAPCSAASSEYCRRHRTANHEAVMERERRYRATLNREEKSEYDRARYLANRDEVIERTRSRYRANPDRMRDEARERYRANRQQIREQARRYRERNRDTISEAKRRFHRENPDVQRERGRRYRQANRAAVAERNRRRKALQAAAPTVRFTPDQLAQRFAYYGNACYLRLDGCTGGADHAEHVKPLSKGGPHMLANLRPACGPCNSRKRDKWPLENHGKYAHVDVD